MRDDSGRDGEPLDWSALGVEQWAPPVPLIDGTRFRGTFTMTTRHSSGRVTSHDFDTDLVWRDGKWRDAT